MEVKNLTYKDILTNINYSFEDDAITSIVGPSGSGKTILTYLMLGLLTPTSGEIINDKKIGYLFQDINRQFFCDNVYDDILLSLKEHNYKLDTLEDQIYKSLKLVKLDSGYLRKKIMELSEGEKVKIALAELLSINPKIIILDEPTTKMDNRSVEELIKLLTRLKREYHKTIIIVSNNINFIYKVTDNILLLSKGKKNISMKKDELINSISKIKKGGMEIPKIIEFITFVEKKKHIKLTSTSEMQELMKDIYRHG